MADFLTVRVEITRTQASIPDVLAVLSGDVQNNVPGMIEGRLPFGLSF
jgi:hypothetical protein